MVAQAGRYNGTPFKGYWGVTQDDSMSPTIFNTVVDAVIQYWMTLVADKEAGPVGFGRALQTLAAIFNADDGILASPLLSRIQEALEAPKGLFDRFGLQTNVDKMVGMTCQTCCMSGQKYEAAYERRMTGKVPYYRSR